MPGKTIIISALTVGFLIFGVYLYLTWKDAPAVQSPEPTPTNTVTVNPRVTGVTTPVVTAGNYSVSWVIVRDAKKISVHENFSDKISAEDAKIKYACDNLTNGGFYSQENKPLGLVINNGELKNNAIDSKLFNGFYSISKTGKFTISYTKPNLDETSIGLQSGPMLLEAGKPLKLSIQKDENARRIAVAKTNKNEVLFLAIYMKSSPLNGPKLSELPKIIDDLQKSTNFEFTDVLNLDGGSHSAFISGEVKLTELARVGTFICVKP